MIPEPKDPSCRVVDDLGRQWATKTNGTWACLGEAVTVDSFDAIRARYGVMEILG